MPVAGLVFLEVLEGVRGDDLDVLLRWTSKYLSASSTTSMSISSGIDLHLRIEVLEEVDHRRPPPRSTISTCLAAARRVAEKHQAATVRDEVVGPLAFQSAPMCSPLSRTKFIVRTLPCRRMRMCEYSLGGLADDAAAHAGLGQEPGRGGENGKEEDRNQVRLHGNWTLTVMAHGFREPNCRRCHRTTGQDPPILTDFRACAPVR